MKSYSVPWHNLGSFSKLWNFKIYTFKTIFQDQYNLSRPVPDGFIVKKPMLWRWGGVALSDFHTLVTPHLLNIPSAISPSILFADFLVQCQHIAKRIKHWPVKLAVSIHTMVILESQLIWLLFCCTIRNLVNCKRWAIVSIPFEIC